MATRTATAINTGTDGDYRAVANPSHHDGHDHAAATCLQVTLLYVDHCRNWSVAADRLRAALAVLGSPPVQIRWRPVHSYPAAAAQGFAGSPTLLINGTDPFPAPSGVTGLCCRFYRTETGDDGAPSVTQLVAALRAALPAEP